jgi:hypothetical protein
MWKDTTEVLFQVLFLYLHGGTEEKHDKYLTSEAGVPAEIGTGHRPNTIQELNRLGSVP